VRRALVVGLLLIACLGPGCATPRGTSTEATSTTLAGPPPALPDGIAQAVGQLIGDYSGATSAHARYAYGTRRQILHSLGMGDLPPNQVDTRVYVVEAEGSFILRGAKVPKGAPEPKGRYLITVWDPDAPASPLDLAVSEDRPALERAGQVTTLVLGVAAVNPPTSGPATPAAPS
jgi:hypothetical protein